MFFYKYIIFSYKTSLGINNLVLFVHTTMTSLAPVQKQNLECFYTTARVYDPESKTNRRWTFHVCTCPMKGKIVCCNSCGAFDPACAPCGTLPRYIEANMPNLIPIHAVIRETGVFVIGAKLPHHMFEPGIHPFKGNPMQKD